MVYRCALFLFLALVVVATTPLAHGLIQVGQVSGSISCNTSGNITPVVGQLVNLQCTSIVGGNTVIIDTDVTNATGNFTFPLNLLDILSYPVPSSCSVTTTLPLANCTASPNVGIIEVPLTLADIVGLFQFFLNIVSGQ